VSPGGAAAGGLSRRQLLVRSGAAVLVPQTLAAGLADTARARPLRGGRFREGVMSGDPAPRAITLWTRLAGVERRGTVRLEVARDRGFRHVVARGRVATGPHAGGAVKARVTGLAPYDQYYYRFETARSESPVGRFRTTPPAGSRQPLTFAFWACQDYTHGHYTVHAAMLREDLDFAVCLGDYIYAETAHTVAGGTGVRDDGIGAPVDGTLPEATTLGDYRAKYALYRSDARLRALQQRAPLLPMWDDHEVQNDYAGGAARAGLPRRAQFSNARQAAAYRAWLESMPTFGRGRAWRRVHRRVRFGGVLDLILLDVRQYRRNQPCRDVIGPPCAELGEPRTLLGRRQLAWAKAVLGGSDAAWKVVGNGVMMMGRRLANGEYLHFDSWQGYPAEREELLGHILRRRIRDVVFLSGDTHAFAAGDVRTADGAGPAAGLEFTCGSVTSATPGERSVHLGAGQVVPGNDADPRTDPAILDGLRAVNPWIEQADVDHHGYALVRASRHAFDVTFKRVQTIKQPTSPLLPDTGFRWRVERGQRSVKGLSGPP
jgi:alkaline phosphatase D